MNPVLFILHVLIEGATAVAAGATSPAAMDAYHDLKALLATKPVLLPALEAIERRPPAGMELTRLVQVLEQERAANDPRIMGAARRLEMELATFRNREIEFEARYDAMEPGAAFSSPRGSKALTDAAEYEVWYGTNRRPVDPMDAGKGYSAQRDAAVHHGSCRVFIPESHKIGSTGSPWWKRLFTGDDRLRLREVKALGREDYWQAVAKRLGAVDLAERHALVFVHGYNVSFEDAALRAAQIGFDLQVRGAMAFLVCAAERNRKAA